MNKINQETLAVKRVEQLFFAAAAQSACSADRCWPCSYSSRQSTG